MSRYQRVLVLILIVCGSPAVHAASPSTGKQVFDHYCAHCHAPGMAYPGTRQLAMRRGRDKAVLEERSDLDAVYVGYVVRHGRMAMPAFVPSDLNAERLEALIEYLTK